MKTAFSLVELSIVLVILGLLTGGILTGQNLIRAAEIRAVSAQLGGYSAAVYTFQDRYFALPGDMTNAMEFWGAADSSGTGGECGNPNTDEGTGEQTCNGDGDGVVGNYSSAEYYERFTFWEHLSNAGLIEGSYTGIGDGAPGTATAGVNSPIVEGDTVAIESFNINPSNTNYYSANLGKPSLLIWDTIFSPEEAWNIDTKLDDGMPAFGDVTVYKPSADANCATSNTDADARYSLTTETSTCRLFYSY